ncbi:hypothetical protein FVE85_4362 [Porphyridium purpureum]|uniref:F-box domain-containing protein n=1 Tax=Porphyridium purpureum TaxID=35688 RepID=A0A5J4YH14_PORPP|nr:hypothetical protein FVE85_4362 [Porphyridium purpureum]|eukprot:POR0159..scf270_19
MTLSAAEFLVGALPVEILERVLLNLALSDVLALCTSCRALYFGIWKPREGVDSPVRLWESFLKLHFGEEGETERAQQGASDEDYESKQSLYKQLYSPHTPQLTLSERGMRSREDFRSRWICFVYPQWPELGHNPGLRAHVPDPLLRHCDRLKSRSEPELELLFSVPANRLTIFIPDARFAGAAGSSESRAFSWVEGLFTSMSGATVAVHIGGEVIGQLFQTDNDEDKPSDGSESIAASQESSSVRVLVSSDVLGSAPQKAHSIDFYLAPDSGTFYIADVLLRAAFTRCTRTR